MNELQKTAKRILSPGLLTKSLSSTNHARLFHESPRATQAGWTRSAEELSSQAVDLALAAVAPLAWALRANESTIAAELLAVQGSPVDLGGYYRPDPAKANAVMRPSKTLNEALSLLRRE